MVVVDNESTDASLQIAKTIQANKTLPGKIIDILSVKTDGYEWGKILRFASDYMHKNLSRYEWIMLIDADAFYSSPVKGMSLLGFLGIVKKCGYNIIDGLLCEFFPTERDDASLARATERIKYCKINYPCPEHKIFRYHPTVDFYTAYGHQCFRNNARICIVKFIYKHYIWVSYEHGLTKIFKERKPRFIGEQKESPWAHHQYRELLPIKKDLIKKSEELQYYDEAKIAISPAAFFKKVIYDKLRSIKAALKGGPKKVVFCPDKRFYNSPFEETIKQLPAVFGLPSTYHFLLTNQCQADCLFCNQTADRNPKKEISISQFKKMFSNIPETEGKIIYLSGGGEPLLCSDLFAIIRHINLRSPSAKIHIRTNGLLIGKYAKELSQLNIAQLEISVHAATPELNSSILQARVTGDIFENIGILNKSLQDLKQHMRKVFCPTLSQSNIDELPQLIKKAAELGIDEVKTSFCRFYPHFSDKETKFNPRESLFFDKAKYDSIILDCIDLASKLKIKFEYEPLFSCDFKQSPCFQPWQTMVIDWEGDIYPCTGGEVWFEKKVKSKEYNFGNLLNEHITQCWNNSFYVMLRRTCSKYFKENFIPECKDCHNSICLNGPNSRSGHILRQPYSGETDNRDSDCTENAFQETIIRP